MLHVFIALQTWFDTLVRHVRRDEGQATAEYALVLLGAAAVALVLVAWAAKSGKVSDLLDAVIDKVMSRL